MRVNAWGRWGGTGDLQVILSFEGFGAEIADVFALVAVRQLVFGQGTGVVEALVADGAADSRPAGSNPAHPHARRPTFATSWRRRLLSGAQGMHVAIAAVIFLTWKHSQREQSLPTAKNIFKQGRDYVNPLSAGPSVDVRFWRLKANPALKEMKKCNDLRPIITGIQMNQKEPTKTSIMTIPNSKIPLGSIVCKNIFQRCEC